MNIEHLTLPIGSVRENEKNPRVITDLQLERLVQSLKDFPEMLTIRPLVVNENNVVLGGNMRLKALKVLNYTDTPVVRVSGLTPDKELEFLVKNNLNYGDWNWFELETNYKLEALPQWGLEVPATLFDDDEEPDFDFTPVNNTIRQITFTYHKDEFTKVLDKLMAIQRREDIESFTEIILSLIDTYYEEIISNE
jgi:hypothetical protein